MISVNIFPSTPLYGALHVLSLIWHVTIAQNSYYGSLETEKKSFHPFLLMIWSVLLSVYSKEICLFKFAFSVKEPLQLGWFWTITYLSILIVCFEFLQMTQTVSFQPAIIPLTALSSNGAVVSNFNFLPVYVFTQPTCLISQDSIKQRELMLVKKVAAFIPTDS